ncbi:MAG: acyl-CoA dehydrogenase family protein [Deltaproteobacteria bacterium]|nr:acyl-CoA dehydrogenase family protein [Deltaproteobacteria bacterium]
MARAILGGYAADRIAFAFAAGYHAALGALVGVLPADARVALCATEEGGAHPRAIHTTLKEAPDGRLRLDGTKRFVTLASLADELLIVATRGTGADGRPRLVLVRVPVHTAGVTLEPLPDLPFASEVPHAAVRLDDVRVDASAVLEGDGYDRYLKPFRTIEDVHVHAALLSFLVRVARRDGWEPVEIERLVSLVAGAHTLALAPPSDAAVHVALAGLIAASRELVASTMPRWQKAPVEERSRFERDLRLMRVAETARNARTESAWRSLAAAETQASVTGGRG